MTESKTIMCLPGGEWLPSILRALDQAGLGLQNKSSRSYVYEFSNANETIPMNFVVTRSRDVWPNIGDPKINTSFGLTGSDIAIEQLANVAWVFPLWILNQEAPRPTVSLAKTPNADKKDVQLRVEDLSGSRVYTSYPNITNTFFAKRNVAVDIVPRDGKIESMWNLDPKCMAIVDIVSSGETLKANGLERIEDILKPEVVLVQNPDLDDRDRLVLLDFQMRIGEMATKKRRA